jgi:excisionase family DNA binding protein
MTAPRPVVPLPNHHLLTCGEVAALFRVDSKTVTRWAKTGRFHTIRTPGQGNGPRQRRFFRSEIDEHLNGPEAGK